MPEPVKYLPESLLDSAQVLTDVSQRRTRYCDPIAFAIVFRDRTDGKYYIRIC